MGELSNANLVWLIPAFPLVGFLLFAFLGKKIPQVWVGRLAVLFVFASFAVSVMVLMGLNSLPGEEKRALASLVPGAQNVPWISIGSFHVEFTALVDPLSMLMCLIVTGVGGLIHLYAGGYMGLDKDFTRFFTYLNLFIFFMLTLVLGSNLLLMFVGWEGVGLCSYLLISFWFEDVENSKAGNKAFIVNRIGDVGFALGMMLIFAVFGTLTFYAQDGSGFLQKAIVPGAITVATATTIALLLFVGATGKSAQFPLYVWLPDAMAGPTPVSALIHAATMVTAGVVMITRVSPIVVQSPTAMTVIACTGLFTAVLAATIALTQNDIKKVLAYSTVSQLGYMFLGCGVGAFTAGMFHVTTHAFFKALLFLGAGSVIHAMNHEQDMRKMGGLKSRIPVTYRTMWFGWLAICGIPPLAGFWSKDEILGAASGHAWGQIFYWVGVITAVMTAFYMTRLMWKTFWSDQRWDEDELRRQVAEHAHAHGDEHGDHGHADHEHEETGSGHGAAEWSVHEAPWQMTVPLVVLAFLSAIGGLIGIPNALGLGATNKFEHFLEPSVAKHEIGHGIPVVLGLVIGAAAALLGIGLAWRAYAKNKATGDLLPAEQKAANPLYRGSVNLWYYDTFTTWLGVRVGGLLATVWAWFDRNIVDGLVNLVASIVGLLSEGFRRIQTGYVGSYAAIMLFGVVAVIVGLLWPILTK
jgi:NADH-quinone oxidoreductase subunit L